MIGVVPRNQTPERPPSAPPAQAESNPCAFKGFTHASGAHTITGLGDFVGCLRLIEWHVRKKGNGRQVPTHLHAGAHRYPWGPLLPCVVPPVPWVVPLVPCVAPLVPCVLWL